MDDELVRALPPGPICGLCGHDLCPCCPLPWCDTLTGDRNTPAADRELCCDGDCRVEWDDYLEWQLELEAVGGFESFEGWTTVAEGPWFPAVERRARGVARWYPPSVFAEAPRVVPLLARVVLWQRNCQLVCTDGGLIGPDTWPRRDDDLVAIAFELARELEAADLGFTQLGRFLMRELPKAAGGWPVRCDRCGGQITGPYDRLHSAPPGVRAPCQERRPPPPDPVPPGNADTRTRDKTR